MRPPTVTVVSCRRSSTPVNSEYDIAWSAAGYLDLMSRTRVSSNMPSVK